MNKKIALYALTGFLGAGKTTLLTNIEMVEINKGSIV